MQVFLVLSTPLLFVLLLSILPEREDLEKQMFKDFVKGILTTFPIITFHILLLGEEGYQWSVSRSYFYYLLRDTLLPLVFCGGIWFLLKGRSSKNYSQDHRFASAGAWLAGAFFFLSLSGVLLHDGRYSVYEIFFLPFVRIALIAVSTYLFSRYEEEYGFTKALFLLLVPISAMIINFIAFTFFVNILPLTIVLTVLFLGVSLFLYIQQGQNVLPAKPVKNEIDQ